MLFEEAEHQAKNCANTNTTHFFVTLYKQWSELLEQMNNCTDALTMYKTYQAMREQQIEEQLHQKTINAEILHNVQLQRLEKERLEEEQQRLRHEFKQQTKELRKYGEYRVHLHDAWKEFEEKFSLHTSQAVIDIELLQTMKAVKKVALLEEESDEILDKAPQQLMSSLEQSATDKLTDLEKQVAVLIHTGFSGKQMPALLHRSEAYLRQVRTRLKKKLDVPSSITLKTYLRAM
jgi:DNA-binding CsgD family transcriptional regulator